MTHSCFVNEEWTNWSKSSEQALDQSHTIYNTTCDKDGVFRLATENHPMVLLVPLAFVNFTAKIECGIIAPVIIVYLFYLVLRCYFPCLPFRNQFQLAGGFSWLIKLITFCLSISTLKTFYERSPLNIRSKGGGGEDETKMFFILPNENKITSPSHYVTITITMMIFMIIYCTRKCFCVSSLISYHRCTCWIVRFTLIYKM